MTVSLYDVAVPTYVRMLNNLSALLDKGEAHAGADVEALLETRLHEDMFPLKRQVQMASDSAKGGAARMAGVEPPKFEDTETTIAELKERIAKTIDFVESVDREAFDAGADKRIELKLPSRTLAWKGQDFLLQFSLPNFMVHVTTAYAILRHKGVPVGKQDYLAGMTMLD